MRKIIRLLLMIVMTLGIVFSVSNFISVGLKSFDSSIQFFQGSYHNGICMDSGDECDIIGCREN